MPGTAAGGSFTGGRFRLRFAGGGGGEVGSGGSDKSPLPEPSTKDPDGTGGRTEDCTKVPVVPLCSGLCVFSSGFPEVVPGMEEDEEAADKCGGPCNAVSAFTRESGAAAVIESVRESSGGLVNAIPFITIWHLNASSNTIKYWFFPAGPKIVAGSRYLCPPMTGHHSHH